MGYVIGIDIGGTCTDCVVADEEGKVTLAKAFSTPPDFSEGILNAVKVAADELGTNITSLLENTRFSCTAQLLPKMPLSTILWLRRVC